VIGSDAAAVDGKGDSALVKLLSNGNYHVMVTAEGTGYSRWCEFAVTRWRDDAVTDQSGTFIYLRDGESGRVWSATARPTCADGVAQFDRSAARFSCTDNGFEANLTVAVGNADDVELRRLHITNVSSRPRTLSVTSFAEIALAVPAVDSAHPAFSKLFVETEINGELGAILATRRPSTPDEARLWFFHEAVVHRAAGAVSFETDRLHFIGRGRDLSVPQALCYHDPLPGHAGPVLDAIAAIRVPLAFGAGESLTIDWFSGMAASRPECVALARRCRDPGAAVQLLEDAGDYRHDILSRIGASEADGRIYERLAEAVVYANAGLRADEAEIAKNRRGQPGLWRFGISGDDPVVLLQLSGVEDLGVAKQMAQAHAFWRLNGIRSELVIATSPAHAGGPSPREALTAMVAAGPGADAVGKPGGIFLLDDAGLDDQDRTLLKCVARIAVTGSAGSLVEQVERWAARRITPQRPPPSVSRQSTQVPAHGAAVSSPLAGGEHDCCSSDHAFSNDLREYVMVVAADRMTPAPWTNVIANPEFGTLVSESGSATTWSENAHEFRLTPWSNDPVSDPNTEAFYIRDEATGRYWSPTLLPTRSAIPYQTRHGFGYSAFEHVENGIESVQQVYVAIDAPVKFSAIILRNQSGATRRVSVTGYLDWVLGDERTKTQTQIVTELDDDTGAIFARNAYNSDFADRVAFFDVEGNDRSACGDRRDFFGIGGTLAVPAALAETRLSGRVGAALDPAAALRVMVDLPAGEERTVVFRLGAAKGTLEARNLVRRWRGANAARVALDAVHAHWRQTLGVLQVQTPDATINALANGWLLYQVMGSRLWGRTAFYQSSGAFGFRDQLQDVMALVHARPGLFREHLLRAASRQFVEGDVQHWWHPPSGKGIRTRCSDDYLWLALVTSRYVDVTDDFGVLDELCPFVESPALKEGEQSRYEQPQVSAQTSSLYSHCQRAIRHGLRYGEHGLPLMGAGDWNDGMNLVGVGGKGESVWLAFFLIVVLRRFSPVARRRGDSGFADWCDSEALMLVGRVEAGAWDGSWYKRAWFDDGTPLGSAVNAECQIDSIAQSWSVLSGAASSVRASAAMTSLYNRLVHPDTRVVQLLDPPFDTSVPSPGYIQGYVRGVRENGGQYTHAAVWAALAFAALGDSDRAWELFELLNPVGHALDDAAVATYKVEPYVVAADIYAFFPHAGRGGWTWYTGSAGWMYQLLVESLLGFRRKGNQFRMDPLLPRDWDQFDMRLDFGESTYKITCQRAASAANARVTVDGVVASDGWVSIQSDGNTHAVVVDVWREPQPLAA
jgi:cyclic beta-1,2-glucan synthetase